MSNDIKNKERMNVLEHIAALKAGHAKPSQKFLHQARVMAKHFNSWKVGEKGPFSRINDSASVVLAQQLEAVAAQVVMEPVEPNVTLEILSNAPDVLPGHETYSFVKGSIEGKSRPISNFADDPQMVSMDRQKVSRKILSYGAGFTYSILDIERAALMGMELPIQGAQAARAVYDRGIEQLLSLGEPDYNVDHGLANQPLGTGADQVRSTTVTDSTAWAPGTADGAKMYDDVAALIAEFERDNQGLFPATHLLLPPQAYALFRMTRLPDSNATALETLRITNPNLVVMPYNKIANVDAGGLGKDSRGLLLNNGPMVVQAIMGAPFTLLPAQPINFAFKIIGKGECGGVAVKQPLGLRYLKDLPTE